MQLYSPKVNFFVTLKHSGEMLIKSTKEGTQEISRHQVVEFGNNLNRLRRKVFVCVYSRILVILVASDDTIKQDKLKVQKIM